MNPAAQAQPNCRLVPGPSPGGTTAQPTCYSPPVAIIETARSAGVILLVLTMSSACGNDARRVEQPTNLPPADPSDAGPVADPTRTEQPSTVFQPALPAGVSPFAPSVFVSFFGIHHGDRKDTVLALLPKDAGPLGPRSSIDIMGSDGFTYGGHFAISWLTETGQIDFVSVKSRAAIDFLTSRGRSDAHFDTLWGVSPQAALGILGQPTEVVERPHAWTFRFDFDTGGRKGTLSLEFSKLSDTLGCSAVSVHYSY